MEDKTRNVVRVDLTLDPAKRAADLAEVARRIREYDGGQRLIEEAMRKFAEQASAIDRSYAAMQEAAERLSSIPDLAKQQAESLASLRANLESAAAALDRRPSFDPFEIVRDTRAAGEVDELERLFRLDAPGGDGFVN